MSKEDADKVIAIMMKADGGCPVCVKSQLLYFIDEFPQFKDAARKAYMAEFDEELQR